MIKNKHWILGYFLLVMFGITQTCFSIWKDKIISDYRSMVEKANTNVKDCLGVTHTYEEIFKKQHVAFKKCTTQFKACSEVPAFRVPTEQEWAPYALKAGWLSQEDIQTNVHVYYELGKEAGKQEECANDKSRSL